MSALADAPEAGGPARVPPAPLRLLLVEDDDADARLVVESLRDATPAPHTLHRAASLAEALDGESDGESDQAPDLVLLDLSLPDSAGLDTLARTRLGLPATPIVVLTGLDDGQMAREALRRGAQDYLVKGSYNPGLLAKTVQHALQRHAVTAALHASEQRFREVFDNAPIGMALCALTDEDLGRIWRANASLCRLSGLTMHELVGMRLGDLFDAPSREMLVGALGAAEVHDPTFIAVLRHADGASRSLEVTTALVELAGENTAIVQLIDVTARLEAEESLRSLALYDQLTGLLNRTLLQEQLALALRRSARGAGQVGVFYVDLDGFKHINDTYGHAVGDQLLAQVGLRLQSALRAGDIAARPGGDEFVVVCEGITSSAMAERIARRLQAAVPGSSSPERGGPRVAGSVGACLTRHPVGADEALRRADAAMYTAKRNGDGVALYSAGMAKATSERLALESALRAALVSDELRVAYQPLRSASDGAVRGVEALVRWAHPELGMLRPASFLDAAEATGLIVPMGAWVLEAACAQVARWNRARPGAPLLLWVNVANQQLAPGVLAEQVRAALAASGLAPSLLRLELTEQVLLAARAGMVEELSAIEALGVGIGLDDFGTGYGALGAVARLPVSFLKLDRGFAAQAPTDATAAAISRAVIGLGRELGLTVVGEGVEEDRQRTWLAGAGCDLLQGHLLGEPALGDTDPGAR